MRFKIGDAVHFTGFGKGLVLEIRNAGQYLVEIKGRTMVARETQLTATAAPRPQAAPVSSARGEGRTVHGSVPSLDLHGYTVEEALEALEVFVNNALLADVLEARVIHGRSGGRIKAAVHARLRQVPSARRFHVDPSNPGVTIIRF